MELYVEFAEVDEAGQFSTNFVANTRTKAERGSPTTRLYSGFSALLQNSLCNVPKSSIGRHSSVLGTDFNFEGHYQSRYKRNSNLDTWAQHSIDAFDFNFSGLMS
ncbi:hypothetical protein J1N35_008304 [Gossypium stocksii]|uniref:Uncharacterized protein n=1 Tax=Gossypium stocksii TaxID=47602 RepID=A0A9D3W8U7_9ROSI|nr:hypothetical protein J1N35_008304 [Gossypium stocksii]